MFYFYLAMIINNGKERNTNFFKRSVPANALPQLLPKASCIEKTVTFGYKSVALSSHLSG